MSSRIFVLVVFVLWSAICWYWYVCGIKQQCGNQPDLAQQAIPFEADDLLAQRADEPQEPAFVPAETAPTTASKPSEPDITKAYVEELNDHVLIHFPYNSIRKEDNAAVDEYLSRLARHLTTAGGTVTLIGHTDNVGDSKTNYAFGLRRAKNVRDLLMAKGVAKTQIVCKSEGEKKPIDTNDNPRGRYQNRRVEIRTQP